MNWRDRLKHIGWTDENCTRLSNAVFYLQCIGLRGDINDLVRLIEHDYYDTLHKTIVKALT